MIKAFLSLLILSLTVIVLTGFSSDYSSDASSVYSCSEANAVTAVTQTSSDECTVTDTIHGNRAFGMCFGTGECRTRSITGPCDVVLEEM